MDKKLQLETELIYLSINNKFNSINLNTGIKERDIYKHDRMIFQIKDWQLFDNGNIIMVYDDYIMTINRDGDVLKLFDLREYLNSYLGTNYSEMEVEIIILNEDKIFILLISSQIHYYMVWNIRKNSIDDVILISNERRTAADEDKYVYRINDNTVLYAQIYGKYKIIDIITNEIKEMNVDYNYDTDKIKRLHINKFTLDKFIHFTQLADGRILAFNSFTYQIREIRGNNSIELKFPEKLEERSWMIRDIYVMNDKEIIYSLSNSRSFVFMYRYDIKSDISFKLIGRAVNKTKKNTNFVFDSNNRESITIRDNLYTQKKYISIYDMKNIEREIDFIDNTEYKLWYNYEKYDKMKKEVSIPHINKNIRGIIDRLL